ESAGPGAGTGRRGRGEAAGGRGTARQGGPAAPGGVAGTGPGGGRPRPGEVPVGGERPGGLSAAPGQREVGRRCVPGPGAGGRPDPAPGRAGRVQDELRHGPAPVRQRVRGRPPPRRGRRRAEPGGTEAARGRPALGGELDVLAAGQLVDGGRAEPPPGARLAPGRPGVEARGVLAALRQDAPAPAAFADIRRAPGDGPRGITGGLSTPGSRSPVSEAPSPPTPHAGRAAWRSKCERTPSARGRSRGPPDESPAPARSTGTARASRVLPRREAEAGE